MGRNLWDTVAKEVRSSSLALFLFVIGFAAGVIGLVLSWEDFVSSYYGLISLQQAFGINAVSADWVLYVMAVAPWVGQVAFIGLWTLDMDRKWALAVGIIWFLLDFVSDVQYRSAGTFIPLESGDIQVNTVVVISAVMTFLYFTVGAELFVTASSALVVTLFPDAVREVAAIRARSKKAVGEARRTWKNTDREEHDRRPQQPMNGNPYAQPVRDPIHQVHSQHSRQDRGQRR